METNVSIKIDTGMVEKGIALAFDGKLDTIREYTEKVIDATLNHLRAGGIERAIIKAVENIMENTLRNTVDSTVGDAIDEYFATGKGKDLVIDSIIKALHTKNN